MSSPDQTFYSSTHIHRGTLYMRIGPMFSGKSSFLNSSLTQFADKGFSVLKILHVDDDRQDVASNHPSGSTHNSSYTQLSPKITYVRVKSLSTLTDDFLEKFNVIGVDESNFFDDLLVNVIKWVEESGKHVFVVGLDGDFQKRKFGQTLDLIPYCDEVIKLSATCKDCLDDLKRDNFKGNLLAISGPFTKKTITDSHDQKVVGGSSIYKPVCRYHHSQ